ncbi:MAG: hypothetical protein O7A09_10905, partial [Proteobacteria bacterium]|nr:hypothetical protein [Pseudomonadota bacterium]
MVPTRAAERVPSIPEPVRDVAGALRRAGHRAWLVGECLPVLLCGESPPGWEIATTAGCGQALAIFPTAVPTRLADSTITVPTRAGPVDVTRTRDGESLEHDLQHRDFTI